MCFDNELVQRLMGGAVQNVGNDLIGAPPEDPRLRQHLLDLFQVEQPQRAPMPDQDSKMRQRLEAARGGGPLFGRK